MKILSNVIINPIYLGVNKNHHPVESFRLCGISQDCFVPSMKTKIYNPYENCYSSALIPEDLTKPAKIVLSAQKPLVFDYNPARFGYLRDKQTGKMVKTMILQCDKGDDKTSYHLMSENLKKEYGYVSFTKCKNPKSCDCKFYSLLEDRPNEGIVGGRLIVDYLQNFDDEKIGGVGELADKLAIKCCIDNELPFNIVSVADRGSHMAHYIRGKRFYPVDEKEDKYRYDYLKENFGKTDPNEIFEELVKSTKLHEKAQPRLGFLEMYMPEQMVKKYLDELKKQPIGA